MNNYLQLAEILSQDRPAILLTEGMQGKARQQVLLPWQQLPPAAAAAWQEKSLYWEYRSDDSWTKAEVFFPPAKLLLAGGGHISQALAAMAALIDLPVTVIEDRPDFANRSFFPDAQEIICEDFAEALSKLDMNIGSFAVIATRGHRYDLDCLQILLKRQLAYIGMVASKSRVKGLKKHLEEKGIDKAQIESLHAPIGLDIKAKTPGEIAVSIIAEIIKEKRRLFPEEEVDQEVLKQAAAMENSAEKAVLATIVETKGSSPRKSGAKMLIYPDGRITGTIGGGCGEAEVKREALQVFDSGRAVVYRLNMTEDVAAAEGMSCGGIMKLLLEPLW